MLSEFSPNVIDLNWFTSLAVQSLSDLRCEVNEACISSMSTLFLTIDNVSLFQLINNSMVAILIALFRGITDTMHQQAYHKFIEFILSFFRICKSLPNYNKDQFRQTLVNVMKEVAEEPKPHLFEQFANYLLETQYTIFEFKNAFENFLIALRKVSPGDKDLFKVEPSRFSSVFGFLFDRDFEIQNGMIAIKDNRQKDRSN